MTEHLAPGAKGGGTLWRRVRAGLSRIRRGLGRGMRMGGESGLSRLSGLPSSFFAQLADRQR
jgi:hypothetical protein